MFLKILRLQAPSIEKGLKVESKFVSPSLKGARIIGSLLRPLGSQEEMLSISSRNRCLEGDNTVEALEPYLAAEGSDWMFRHCIITNLCSGNSRPCVARFLCADARAHRLMHGVDFWDK